MQPDVTAAHGVDTHCHADSRKSEMHPIDRQAEDSEDETDSLFLSPVLAVVILLLLILIVALSLWAMRG